MTKEKAGVTEEVSSGVTEVSAGVTEVSAGVKKGGDIGIISGTRNVSFQSLFFTIVPFS